jgi:hypothetical protein
MGMQIEYAISEQDFMDAQRLAIRNSPMRLVRWTRWVLPLFGVGLLIFLINAVVKQGFSMRAVPGLAFCLLFISLPLLNRNNQKKLYAKTTSMHGKLSLEASDEGLQFRGPSFSSQVGWSNFCKFFEDEKSFVLYQNSQVFNIVPKRGLSPDQVTSLRGYLDQKIGRSA